MPRLTGQIDRGKASAILEAAKQVMAERGLSAPIDEIARRAGVSKQTVYNHYGSKTDLLRALVAQRTEEMTAPLRGQAALENPQAALAIYAHGLLLAVGNANKNAVLRAIIQGASDLPEVALAFFEDGPLRSKQAIADFLTRLTAAGRLKVDDPMMAAEFFGGMVVGQRQLRSMITGQAVTEAEAEAVAQEAARRLLRAYLP